MYLYFDRYGTLKEQITFNPARVGNSNVNKIFVYWEGVEEFTDWAQELALQTRYLLQDNTQYPSATTFGFSAQPETAELPFDKNQDLKYFKYYKEYKFLTIDIPDEVLSYNGAVKSYIWVLNADKKRILGLGVFAFMVDGDINEVIPDENISLAQWNMISAQLGLLSGSVIDVTCDIATNTLKVYYANGLTAIRNLPPNDAQTTISSNFLQEMIFSADTWVQDGENGYYTYFYSMGVGYNDNKFFVQLERDGKYNSDYYNKTGSYVLSDNIFKGSDGSVLLYSNEPYSGRLLVVGGDLLSGNILVTGLSYNSVNSQLSYKTADGITHTIYLGINEKFDKSNITQTIGDSGLKVMSQKVVTELLNDKLDKWYVVQTTGDSTDKVMSQKAATDNFASLVDGKVPESQLPSYVDDVVEYDSKSAFPATGETGKIYVDKSTNLTYRWSGSTYIQVGGGDLNIENGTGTGSLVQKRLKSDGVTWTTAKAYQGASTALGGGTQAGRTEEEFNAYFWDSTKNVALNGGAGKNSSGEILDNRSLTYKKSYSFGVAEGEQTKALGRGSHSEGYYTKTEGDYSHVEGWKTVSRGLASHAEGEQTTASGDFSHAEGFGTSAKGSKSHSEGMSTEAIGDKSHVEGFATRALEMYQHVEGVYNADNPNALHIVGNGTSENARKNAFVVLKDGRAKVQTAPTDDDDVVRKADLAGIGGGGKLYLHKVPFKKSDNAITVNIIFYSLSDQSTSDSKLIKITKIDGLLYKGEDNMGMPLAGVFYSTSEDNFDFCDFYGINLVTGQSVEAASAKFIKQNEIITEI